MEETRSQATRNGMEEEDETDARIYLHHIDVGSVAEELM